MKTKTLILASLAWLFAACAEDVERPAQEYFARAQASYAHKQYHTAKLQLDSIKVLYPKAFDTRKQANALLLQVERSESEANKAFADSLLHDVSAKVAPLTAKLHLDKDPRYQEVGHYYAPAHRIENNVSRSYLRPQVDERGACSIVSFYRGKPIQAHTLRLTATDGTFVELKAAYEPYVSSDALGRTERTDFPLAPDNTVATFVALQQGKSLKATLVGEAGTATVSFAKAEAQALITVSELGSVLRSVSDLQAQSQELERRIRFFTTRIEGDTVQ